MPTPTAILKLRGSKRAKYERVGEPQPTGLPEPPAWLSNDARAAWEHVYPMLVAMGVLTRIDGPTLSRYCHVWARWRKVEQFIAEHGETYPVKDGNGKTRRIVAWPQVATARNLAQQLMEMEREFGMTPSARTRIKVEGVASQPVAPIGKARFFKGA